MIPFHFGVLYEDRGKYGCVATNTLVSGEASASSEIAQLIVSKYQNVYIE